MIAHSLLVHDLANTALDEAGNTFTTAGALLPAGYQKSEDPEFPWACPIRSCRRLLPSLAGLGKHFCNSHRATRFNDNLDGTLSDLGPYINSNVGDGKSSGGFAKPALIVSKKTMSLEESPMVEPSLHRRAAESGRKPTVPQRGGPRRISGVEETPTDDVEDAPRGRNEPLSADPLDDETCDSSAAAGTDRVYDMANPDRPYNMWPGKQSACELNEYLIIVRLTFTARWAGVPYACSRWSHT